MELKNAVAVCLIALFSATLVVLIARSLDSRAAARLEPQLTRIAEELEAIRRQGGMAPAGGEATAAPVSDDALVVYYFHGVRCATCRAAEATALETLESEYASKLADGEIVWRVLDYMQDPAAKEMAGRFGVATATVVLVRKKGGEMDSWNRLDRVLALAEDKPALSEYLRREIDAMLETPEGEPAPPEPDEPPSIPVPDVESEDLPLPGISRHAPGGAKPPGDSVSTAGAAAGA